IGSTKTKQGLKVHCRLDERKYPKGIKVTDEEMDALNIERADFHGEWNYTIHPRNKT
ncbi:MAG: ISAzo13 family transposase, partial [Candidatus Atribacteria bacterium]|nr:ISAzo13 family transposase [Candidatus Atribacteria bacterium]